MTPDLRHEIHQRAPFKSPEQEAFLQIGRTAVVLQEAFERLLKPFGISLTQYNVLRILRGAADGRLCRNEIRDRLLSRMPDVTRLLDRMEEGELVLRVRSEEDRRQVSTQLTPKGRKLVEKLDPLVEEEHRKRLGHLSASQLQSLTKLLTLAREQG